MGWNIGAEGFRVILQARVPTLARNNVRADVDQFLGPSAPVGKVGDARSEGVEIADDQIDRDDAVVLEVGSVTGVVPIGQDPPVHLRVERDHPVAEHDR